MCILIKILWFFFLGPMKVLYTIQSTKGLFKCIMMQRFFSIPCPCHLPIASLSSYIHTYIFNPWWDYLLVHGETIRNWHEKWYFTFFSRGIGIQFSTSNNTTSRNGHWLVYRHCAKLTRKDQADSKLLCQNFSAGEISKGFYMYIKHGKVWSKLDCKKNSSNQTKG